MGHPLWPIYDLRLRTERLELRLPNEDEIVELCRLAKAGVHPPGEMPFGIPWTSKPSPRFEREFIQYHWGARSTWSPAAWNLELAVFHDGRPIGQQGLFARDFAVLKTVGTGSWLGRQHQGRGIGKEMRRAVLALAFDGLGADVAESQAFLDNLASAGVSRALGYTGNGLGRLAPDGVARDTERYRMTSAEWHALNLPATSIEGLEACLDLFGDGAREPAS
jgi:RimJ/RimL family protein N-acetyltransferase